MKNILIVDDNEQSIYLLQTLLSGNGYRVAAAANGAEALDKARSNPPEMIISDILMPVMDGFELCREWKSDDRLKDVPFVFYTATYTDAKDEEFALSLGAERFIVKPAEPEAFLAKLKEVFVKHEAGRLTAPREPRPDEAVFIKVYNEALIRKLEAKMLQVEQANQRLEREMAERSRAEDALGASEIRYRRLFEAAKDGILILDAETGMILDVNPFLVKLLGFSHEQFLEKTIWELGFLKDIIANKSNLEELKNKKYIRYENLPLETASGRRIEVEFISNAYQAYGHEVIQCNLRDITERKQSDRLTREVLDLLNRESHGSNLIHDILALIRNNTRFEAVAIRLGEGEDFPYYEANGFPESFVQSERFLCSRDQEGGLIRDSQGNPWLECMCGNVISRRTDPSLPFFSEGGSFWTNSTTELLASTTEADRQARTRNRCQGEGYESVALIPLLADGNIIGLLQLNDKRPDCFTREMIHFFEGIGASIGIALARRRAEEELLKSEERYRSLIENIDLGINVIDLDYTIVMANNATGAMLGKEIRDLVGKTCYREFEKRGQVCPRCPGKKTMETGRPEEVETGGILDDGSRIDVRVRSFPILEASGEIAGFIEVVQDITERKQLEEQLHQAMKMEAVGRLAGGVAHDFNNALTPILVISNILSKQFRPDDPVHQDLKEIQEAALRCVSLTRQLLAFSRRQPMEMITLNLNDVVADIEKMLARVIGEDIELETFADPDLGSVRADVGQIEQIIVNLAVNARDAMPDGGKITIETRNVDLDEEYARTHASIEPGPCVMLAVSDTGAGMSEEVRARIFEPFFTTKEKGRGTGLGLSTVYGIVKQSGGDIWVYSEPGAGTTFKIYLPRVEEKAERISPAGKMSEEDFRGSETILLVEDEDPVRKVARRILEKNGYKVLEADGGERAIMICGQSREPIHLVITDVVMPGMSGKELAEKISALFPAIKIIYVSGYTDNAIVYHGVLDKGANFLQKPFTIESLSRKVREVLRS